MAITRSVPFSALPSPGPEYDRDYMNRLVNILDQIHTQLVARRPLVATTLNISQLPTSATGLLPGDLWNDANTVKVIP